MIIYKCDRCDKATDYVHEVNWRIFGVTNQAAQYKAPESCHLCSRCICEFRRFNEGFAVEATERRAALEEMRSK